MKGRSEKDIRWMPAIAGKVLLTLNTDWKDNIESNQMLAGGLTVQSFSGGLFSLPVVLKVRMGREETQMPFLQREYE